MKVPIELPSKPPRWQFYYNPELKALLPHLFPVDRDTTYHQAKLDQNIQEYVWDPQDLLRRAASCN
jgi:hypothetical protein